MDVVRPCLALCVALFASEVMAFVDPPSIEPETAESGETVVLHLRTGGCDGVLGGGNNPAVTLDGNEIDVLIDGLRRFDLAWCVFPIVNHAFPLGGFEPGHYSVAVRYRFTPFGLPTEIETLGVLPLEVIGPASPPAVAVPATSWMALLLLIFFIVIGRFFHERQFQTGSSGGGARAAGRHQHRRARGGRVYQGGRR